MSETVHYRGKLKKIFTITEDMKLPLPISGTPGTSGKSDDSNESQLAVESNELAIINFFDSYIKKINDWVKENKQINLKHSLCDYNRKLYKNVVEFIEDTLYDKIVIIDDVIFEVTREEVDCDEDIFRSKKISEDEFEFEVKYYNGWCWFSEAIEYSLNNKE